MNTLKIENLTKFSSKLNYSMRIDEILNVLSCIDENTEVVFIYNRNMKVHVISKFYVNDNENVSRMKPTLYIGNVSDKKLFSKVSDLKVILNQMLLLENKDYNNQKFIYNKEQTLFFSYENNIINNINMGDIRCHHIEHMKDYKLLKFIL